MRARLPQYGARLPQYGLISELICSRMARVVQFKQVFDTPLSKREARRASDTRQRILDAADQLFGQHRYRATSMRALTEAAGVNLAAVNYHFGSKADLLRATLERHLGPINAERLSRLDALEREVPGGASVERILDALYRPTFEFQYAARVRAKWCSAWRR